MSEQAVKRILLTTKMAEEMAKELNIEISKALEYINIASENDLINWENVEKEYRE